MVCPKCKRIAMAVFKAQRETTVNGEQISVSYEPLPITHLDGNNGKCKKCGHDMKVFDAPPYEDWLDTLSLDDPFNPANAEDED